MMKTLWLPAMGFNPSGLVLGTATRQRKRQGLHPAFFTRKTTGRSPASSPYSWMRATLSSAPLSSFSPFLMLTNSTLFFASSARLFGWVGTL